MIPDLKVIAAAMTPDVAALPESGPKPASSTSAHAEDCAKLTRILATRDEIAARYGEERARLAIKVAKAKFKAYGCAK